MDRAFDLLFATFYGLYHVVWITKWINDFWWNYFFNFFHPGHTVPPPFSHDLLNLRRNTIRHKILQNASRRLPLEFWVNKNYCQPWIQFISSFIILWCVLSEIWASTFIPKLWPSAKASRILARKFQVWLSWHVAHCPIHMSTKFHRDIMYIDETWDFLIIEPYGMRRYFLSSLYVNCPTQLSARANFTRSIFF